MEPSYASSFFNSHEMEDLFREAFDASLVEMSCHGPGSLHTRMAEGDATISFAYRPLGAGDCEKCHHGEFNRPFRWNEFWPPIKHGKEPVGTVTSQAHPLAR